MKKEFMAMFTNNNKKYLEKREGDYDAKYNVFYHKTDKGWNATDEFSGLLIVQNAKTKKECTETLAKTIDKINELRCGEKFLKGVINYQELLEDIKEK